LIAYSITDEVWGTTHGKTTGIGSYCREQYVVGTLDAGKKWFSRWKI
jgi:hypothetical protein